MTHPDEAKAKAAAVYNAAADFFDHPANSFWNRFGRISVEMLRLQPGDSVLDVCCGSGASALPAAEAVGGTGQVIGIDLAENLLAAARNKAAEKNLNNVDFRQGDLLDTGFGDASFDAVACVFGIFFVLDIPAAIRELWRVVRPGGKLAVTTWGADLFEPANSMFWDSIRSVRPDLYKAFNPWDRISDPAALRAAFRDAGVLEVEVTAQQGSHRLGSPDDWWTLLLGSGYRGTLDQLAPDLVAQIRRRNLAAIADNRVCEVQTNVLYAIAQKPA